MGSAHAQTELSLSPAQYGAPLVVDEKTHTTPHLATKALLKNVHTRSVAGQESCSPGKQPRSES